MTFPLTAPQLLFSGRWDLYGPVHKALRKQHAVWLQRLGSADFSGDIAALLDAFRQHLQMAAVHLFDEEAFIHHRLEARSPGATLTLERQHAGHHQHLDSLRAMAAALQGALQRDATSGHALYLAFSQVVADDLQHMAYEETVVWPQLCALFSDAELQGIEADIVANLPATLAAAITAAMVSAVNPAQRLRLLGGLQAQLSAMDYADVMNAVVLPSLSESDCQPLRAAGLLASGLSRDGSAGVTP